MAEEEKSETKTALDFSAADTKMYLIKLPNFLHKYWSEAVESGRQLGSVGSLVIDPSKPEEFEFELNTDNPDLARRPAVYKVRASAAAQSFRAFSENSKGEVSLCGVVTHKGDMRPTLSGKYSNMLMEKKRAKEAKRKSRTVGSINEGRAEVLNKQKMYQARREAALAKRYEQKKEHMDRDEVENALFRLFNEQERWSMTDLERKTGQPRRVLDPVLQEIAEYTKFGKFKFTFALKEHLLRKKRKTDDEE